MILVLLPLIIDFQPTIDGEDQSDLREANQESLVPISEIKIHDKQLTISTHISEQGTKPSVDIVQEQKDRMIVNFSGVRLAEPLSNRLVNGQAALEPEDPFVSSMHVSVDENKESQIQLVLDFNGPASYALLPLKVKEDIRIQLIPETYRVVLDAGHGGKDPGAIGASGRYEKEFTLGLVNKVKERLMDELHFVVELTREDDRFVSLQERAALAKEWGADAFISVHGNTFEQRISGTESYYYHPGSLELGQQVHDFLVKGTGLPDRELRRRGYRVLKNLDRVPGVLLEIGYLSNMVEEKRMWTEEFQIRVAESIVDGLKNYFAVGGD